jgi:hypothetical protein
MDTAEIRRLAAEVSAQHGIRVDPDDPIMAVVTLNRLILERALADACSLLHSATDEFNRAAERIQIRAGAAVAGEVRESVAAVRAEIHNDIENARLKAFELINTLHGSQPRSRIWLGMSAGLLAGAGLFLAGVLTGMFLR